MDFLQAFFSNVSSWLILAIGLGLVIFVHELGHFAVAKWVGVKVDRFSIGFGPVLWSFWRGETEYAISAIPFGGYVKMLGQDDVTPAEMTREDLKLDPRSYAAQSVPKRMAIISAGVVMNIIFGFLSFLLVFNVGCPYTPPVVASVEPGGPAWQVGIERGDKILRVNGEQIIEFDQLHEAVVLSDPEKALDVEVARGDKTLSFHIVPALKFGAPQIGIEPSSSDLKLDGKNPVLAGLAASKAEGTKFQGGDRITQVDDVEMHSYPQFVDYLAHNANKELRVRVVRTPQKDSSAEETSEVVVPGQAMRDWRVRFQMGKVIAVRADSPAAAAGIQAGDVIQSVAGQPCDPFRLPDLVAGMAGQEVEIEIQRASLGEPLMRRTVVPDDKPGWITPPHVAGYPLSVPALGVAYQLEPTIVEQPDAESPAGRAGLQKLDQVWAVTLISPAKAKGKKPIEEKTVIDDKHPLLPWIFWELQFKPETKISLTVKRDGKEIATEPFSPDVDESWQAPYRGIHPVLLVQKMEPQGFSRAIALGYETTKRTIVNIYLMLRRLIFSRTVSPENLAGPIGIFRMGHAVAQTDVRLFIRFLAMLSVNLAVINFLPIPILDGGHMVLLGWEGIRGKPASERVVIAASYCGLLLILCLFLFVTWNDIAHMVR